MIITWTLSAEAIWILRFIRVQGYLLHSMCQYLFLAVSATHLSLRYITISGLWDITWRTNQCYLSDSSQSQMEGVCRIKPYVILAEIHVSVHTLSEPAMRKEGAGHNQELQCNKLTIILTRRNVKWRWPCRAIHTICRSLGSCWTAITTIFKGWKLIWCYRWSWSSSNGWGPRPWSSSSTKSGIKSDTH